MNTEQTNEAIELARKITSLAPMLKSSVYLMQLDGADMSGLHLAIIAMNIDGSGKIGPKWELGEFLNDLIELGKLVHTEDELIDQSSGGIASIFGRVTGGDE